MTELIIHHKRHEFEVQQREERAKRDFRRQQAVWKAARDTGYKPLVYWNMDEGVLAVTTPAGMEKSYYPLPKCFLFVTEGGAEAIKRTSGDTIYRHKVAGSSKEAGLFVKLYNLEFVHRADLYVPFVRKNFAIDIQEMTVEDAHHKGGEPKDWYRELVASQFPEPERAALLAL
ncbi:hypothetical protein KW784_00125 [Candidatus Parcubacteria bacterium]|nr:hypothetical protein [Candidatus Parcubacteria bacterium]